ncbi:MAG: hypothetical protein APF80_12555 [Alphaproteobacteria bacterium BRH_c36]|nr:MAG: hypothetical protein APF80_12555 [Alphaproteobacteria bacterium BRH_c36]
MESSRAVEREYDFMAQPMVVLKENQGADGGTLAQLPEEYSWLEGNQRYVVSCFYTPNYLAQVTSLKRSLEAHGINHFLKRYERLGSWESTTRLKPVFLDYCLKKFPDHDVLYLDADAVVRQPLTFFDDIRSDICLLFHPTVLYNKHYLRISAGTVYCRNTDGGRRFARLWMAQEEKCSALNVDEDMIYMAFGDMQGISITVLPPEYYKIYDNPGLDPVIEHFQASRHQFKWTKAIRQVLQFGSVAGIVLAIVLIWWLLENVVIAWR